MPSGVVDEQMLASDVVADAMTTTLIVDEQMLASAAD